MTSDQQSLEPTEACSVEQMENEKGKPFLSIYQNNFSLTTSYVE